MRSCTSGRILGLNRLPARVVGKVFQAGLELLEPHHFYQDVVHLLRGSGTGIQGGGLADAKC